MQARCHGRCFRCIYLRAPPSTLQVRVGMSQTWILNQTRKPGRKLLLLRGTYDRSDRIAQLALCVNPTLDSSRYAVTVRIHGHSTANR